MLLIKRFSTKSHPGLILCLCLYAFTVVYAFFLYTTTLQYYIVVGMLGMCIGSTQSLTKAVLAEYLPSGFEVTYFSLLSLTGGMTSWICPLLSGLVNDNYGSYKYALLFVIFPFFVVGIVILFVFNPGKAREEKLVAEG